VSDPSNILNNGKGASVEGDGVALVSIAHPSPEPTLEDLKRDGADLWGLLAPFFNVDTHDWDKLFTMLPEGGMGDFWRRVLTEFRSALETVGPELELDPGSLVDTTIDFEDFK